jgi:hypothetical protein
MKTTYQAIMLTKADGPAALKCVEVPIEQPGPGQLRVLRVLTIFDGLIFALFEVRFPFRFPHAVRDNGKRNWELDSRIGVVGRRADDRGIKGG